MTKTIDDITKSIDTSILIKRPLTEWRPTLSEECQVYVCGENYLAKRFDQINYKFCNKIEAKEILIDNLYALLRFKYFPKITDEIDDRIDDIISSFSTNLKTTLKKVSLDNDSDSEVIKLLPSTCIAFRNGVYDFYKNCWLFKYDIIEMKENNNTIYMYDKTYAIMWYINLNFEPLDININDLSLTQFIDLMKELTSTNRNYCFELMYNMSHNIDNKFSINKFRHLCEIVGFTILQDFSQHFVIFVGSGQNGKNSLFDGCFTSRVIPRPSANDLDEIENDRFITGSMENKAHNIFLESSAKTYSESKMIKALTGSMYQTIQNKGENKYSGYINCKQIFAANDQDKIKFSDTTIGFRRRINLFEVYYKWDSKGSYLLKGDYYDTTFSDSLAEIKNDISNTIIFIYLGMYGILSATNNFTRNFKFTYNDWKLQYTDIDFDLKDKIENITPKSIVKYINSSKSRFEEFKPLLYDLNKNRLYNSWTLKSLGYSSFQDMLNMFLDDESCISYFVEYDCYINLRLLQKIIGDLSLPGQFTQNFKKLYSLTNLPMIYNNQPYAKCSFVNGKLKIKK